MRKRANISRLEIGGDGKRDDEREERVGAVKGKKAKKGHGELSVVKKEVLEKKMFLVSPEASSQFAMLKVKTKKKGPVLIKEALNLLFERYREPPVA